jgi:hypothetical protein
LYLMFLDLQTDISRLQTQLRFQLGKPTVPLLNDVKHFGIFYICILSQCLCSVFVRLVNVFNTCHFIKIFKHYMFRPELAILKC